MAGEWSLTLIEDIWEEPNGEIWFSGRWYYRPEETHTGRQVCWAKKDCLESDALV